MRRANEPFTPSFGQPFMALMSSVKSALKNILAPRQRDALGRVYANRRGLIDGGYLAKLATIFGTDKWGLHWYAQHYERHFGPLRWKRLTLLEIGIGGEEDPLAGGASLRSWKWFFPRGQIVGVDIYDKKAHETRRIRTFRGSQTDAEFLRSVIAEIGNPQIIVDDGSHRNDHVITTFNVLFPLLRDGGIYVIEDMQSSYWPSFGGAPAGQSNTRTMMEFFKGLADGLNHAEYLDGGYVATYADSHIVSMHFYHNMLFIYKGANDEGSNCVVNGALTV